ncbi:unnamed protein product [Fraxinus pennsylvanica]|uniref:Uncharacterized protein n=1 Tax=Fraxinus pennsylvanica TaxID=56036 RepID=A0AAD1Z9T1_9LAMI|nr:unnamed protein product [Fraxinus pennsylvanica]
MSESEPPRRRPPPALHKQNSWSPDTVREEAWTNRKKNYRMKRGKFSVTDDDLEELRACFELGFNFDSPDLDPKLSSAFPALGFYHAVNQQYSNSFSRSSSSLSNCDSVSSVGSPSSIFDPDDDPAIVKTRLKHWARIVACSVRQSSPN